MNRTARHLLTLLTAGALAACAAEPFDSPSPSPEVNPDLPAPAPPRVPHWLQTADGTRLVWTRSPDDAEGLVLAYEVCFEGSGMCATTEANFVEAPGRVAVTVAAVGEGGLRSEVVTLSGSDADPGIVADDVADTIPSYASGDFEVVQGALTSAPTVVASPVYGPLTVIGPPTNCPGNAQGKWGFCQHQTGYHKGNSKYAWDVNLNWTGYGPDMDANAEFSAVGFGKVTRAGGDAYNTIVVEHSSGGKYWFSSEYLHAKTVYVKKGDLVTPLVFLGRIGKTSKEPIPNHLHLRLAQKDAKGTPVSFDCSFKANLASITLGGSSAMKVGKTQTLPATGARTNGTVAGPLPAVNLNDTAASPQTWWTSSNKAVASVDGNGKVTAKAKGTAVITIRWHGVSASRTIGVK